MSQKEEIMLQLALRPENPKAISVMLMGECTDGNQMQTKLKNLLDSRLTDKESVVHYCENLMQLSYPEKVDFVVYLVEQGPLNLISRLILNLKRMDERLFVYSRVIFVKFIERLVMENIPFNESLNVLCEDFDAILMCCNVNDSENLDEVCMQLHQRILDVMLQPEIIGFSVYSMNELEFI